MPGLYGLPRRLAKRGDRWLRELTAPWRMLPGLLIIGAQKSGTTSLFRYLISHPQVLPGTVKEVRYFNAHSERGLHWYRSHFPLRHFGWSVAAGREPITVDASTAYLFSSEAPARISNDLSDARFVALLRDPVDRAWSHYRHSVREGHEELGFGEALAQEETRITRYRSALAAGEPVFRTLSFHTYKARGRYVEQLERWFSAFDRDRFCILRSEALFADPQGVTNRVLSFLGMDPVQIGNPGAYNAGSTGAMSAAQREGLQKYFEPYNQRLYDLLGWDRAWA